MPDAAVRSTIGMVSAELNGVHDEMPPLRTNGHQAASSGRV